MSWLVKPACTSWWDFDRPLVLFGQHFGTSIEPNDTFTPVLAYASQHSRYYRPWSRINPQESGLSTVKNESNQFSVKLDVQQFRPDELSVKTIGNAVVVEGKHEDKQSDDEFVYRHFVRTYPLPSEVEPESVMSSLSPDGVLTISAPKKLKLPVKPKERIVPIEKLEGTSSTRDQEKETPEADSYSSPSVEQEIVKEDAASHVNAVVSYAASEPVDRVSTTDTPEIPTSTSEAAEPVQIPSTDSPKTPKIFISTCETSEVAEPVQFSTDAPKTPRISTSTHETSEAAEPVQIPSTDSPKTPRISTSTHETSEAAEPVQIPSTDSPKTPEISTSTHETSEAAEPVQIPSTDSPKTPEICTSTNKTSEAAEPVQIHSADASQTPDATQEAFKHDPRVEISSTAQKTSVTEEKIQSEKEAVRVDPVSEEKARSAETDAPLSRIAEEKLQSAGQVPVSRVAEDQNETGICISPPTEQKTAAAVVCVDIPESSTTEQEAQPTKVSPAAKKTAEDEVQTLKSGASSSVDEVKLTTNIDLPESAETESAETITPVKERDSKTLKMHHHASAADEPEAKIAKMESHTSPDAIPTLEPRTSLSTIPETINRGVKNAVKELEAKTAELAQHSFPASMKGYKTSDFIALASEIASEAIKAPNVSTVHSRAEQSKTKATKSDSAPDAASDPAVHKSSAKTAEAGSRGSVPAVKERQIKIEKAELSEPTFFAKTLKAVTTCLAESSSGEPVETRVTHKVNVVEVVQSTSKPDGQGLEADDSKAGVSSLAAVKGKSATYASVVNPVALANITDKIIRKAERTVAASIRAASDELGGRVHTTSEPTEERHSKPQK